MKNIISFPLFLITSTAAVLLAVGCGQQPAADKPDGNNTPEKQAKAPDDNKPAPLPEPPKAPAEDSPFKLVEGQGTSFANTAKHLEAGGTFYLYLSTEQFLVWVDKAFSMGEQLLGEKSLGLGEGEVVIAKLVLAGVKKMFLDSGIRELDGVGASTVELEDGIKRNLVMFHHDPAKGKGLIWKMFGTRAHEQDILKLAPSDTAYAAHGDLDVVAGIDWLKDFVTKNTTPEVAAQMAAGLAEANKAIELEKLLESLGGRYGMLLTLDENHQIPIPLPELMDGAVPDRPTRELVPLPDRPDDRTFPAPTEPNPSLKPKESDRSAVSPGFFQAPVTLQGASPQMPKIPAPGLAIVLKVKDNTIKTKLLPMLAGVLEQQAMELREVEDNGVKLSVIDVPLPPDVPEEIAKLLKPAIFQNDGYLVFASSLKLAKRMIAVQQGRDKGLADTAEFKKLAKGMNLNGNQFAFLSKRVGHHYGDFLRSTLALAPQEMPQFAREWMVKLSTFGMDSQLSVMQALPDGHRYVTHTTGLTQESTLVMTAALIPVAITGVAASMLLPALAAAKNKANVIKSMNNIKQLGVSVVGYAFDHDDKVPEKWCDAILPDMGTLKVFASPQDPADSATANAGQKVSSYALNAALAGKSLENVNPNTVLLFECHLGWNGMGGLKEAREQGGHLDRITVVTVEGVTRQISPFELEQLRWKP